jgi:hypothetical protein
MPTKAAAKVDTKLKDEVLARELSRHSLEVLAEQRREKKIARIEARVVRALKEGLTAEMVAENIAKGRPPHWLAEPHWIEVED